MKTVPRLAKGKGFKGAEFFGCFNTGMAPAIFHSKTGKYLVGPEIPCREAMERFITLSNKRVWDDRHGRRVWLFKGRGPAVKKFMELCQAREDENANIRREYQETKAKAAAGDIGAALKLGDY